MGKAKPSSSAPKEMDVNTLHRKLEPIYELIDGGNDKAALKTIDRELLGKFPQMQIGRVLKGIVLSRLGKDGEGLALCEAVRHAHAFFVLQKHRPERGIDRHVRAGERPGPEKRTTPHVSFPSLRQGPVLRETAGVRDEAVPRVG